MSSATKHTKTKIIRLYDNMIYAHV